MWLIAEYEAVTLFSLKLSSATASGGKTLLVPTPYAIKMALLDAACRVKGVVGAEQLWPQVRDLQVAIRPAAMAVVSNLFQKVLKPYKNPPKPGTPNFGPFQRTIAYREYVQLVGALSLAVGWEGDEADEGREWLGDLLLNINYLGKRGGFMQLVKQPTLAVALPGEFVMATADQVGYAVHGTLQLLDDCTPALSFAKANIYSGEKVRLGKERVLRNIVLPCRLTKSSKSYSLYERFER
jgi:hypothetical protein